MSGEPDHDLLAAEYVLGSLEGDERREAERLLTVDPAFARSVAAWQQRLAPLACHAAPVQPPAELWRRIEAGIAPAATADILPLRHRVRVWQTATAAALAIAASLAAFIVLRQPEQPRVAVLSPLSGGAPVLMATAETSGRMLVRPTVSIPVPAGKDLELWALAQGETKPYSLGVLPASGRQLTARLAPNTQLLVSLEPKGGSPTGQPTGPVLYGGWLTTVELPRG
ncbi:MAG TPA: anti-sigma factor [Acetobacteraceae bacterium]|jgi:anti-sigma-K factor RskA